MKRRGRYVARPFSDCHIDGDWPGYGLDPQRGEMQEWDSLRSRLTMLLYLNGAEHRPHFLARSRASSAWVSFQSSMPTLEPRLA